MFRSDNDEILRGQLNRFNVPMFIAERRAGAVEFQLLALNAAHEAQSGLDMDAVKRKPLSALLSPDQAAAVNARYAACVAQKPPLRYREMLEMKTGPIVWDTTLHHIKTKPGHSRIVGSAIVAERILRKGEDRLAFEDVRFFAATSSCKLEQVAMALDALEQGRIDPAQLTGSAGMLAGLCRAIDHTLQELRDIATERLNAEAARPGILVTAR